jgi:hypothetical protein
MEPKITGPYLEQDEFSTSYTTFVQYILILSFNLRIVIKRAMFLSDMPIKIVYVRHFMINPMRATCPIHLIFLHVIILTISDLEYKWWRSTSSHPPIIPPKYCHQRPVLKYPFALLKQKAILVLKNIWNSGGTAPLTLNLALLGDEW